MSDCRICIYTMFGANSPLYTFDVSEDCLRYDGHCVFERNAIFRSWRALIGVHKIAAGSPSRFCEARLRRCGVRTRLGSSEPRETKYASRLTTHVAVAKTTVTHATRIVHPPAAASSPSLPYHGSQASTAHKGGTSGKRWGRHEAGASERARLGGSKLCWG